MIPRPLPLELACMVMQYLRDDAKSLKKCSLIHRSWTREAQKLLFSGNFVRIGVPQDSGCFPLYKEEEKHNPLKFMIQIAQSPHLVDDIRAVRINIADMHRTIMSTHKAWSLLHVLAAISEIDRLETLAFFSVDYLRDFYPLKVKFPSILKIEPLLEEHFGSVTRLELQTPLYFSNLLSLQNLLCSLPALEEFAFCPFRTDESPFELPNPPSDPPSNVSLRRLMFEHKGKMYSERLLWFTSIYEWLIGWLATTETRHSLEYLVINTSAYYPASLDHLMGAITRPFSMVNHVTHYPRCPIFHFPFLHSPNLEELDLHIKEFHMIGTGSISICDLIQLSIRLRRVPLLQSLTFTLHVDDRQTVSFKSPRPGSCMLDRRLQAQVPKFLNLKNLHIRFNEESKVRRVYNCHNLREAFKAYDHSDIITFASGLEIFDGPPDEETPAHG